MSGIGIVRTWVRLYTTGLPASLRDSRRDEIDSDLWEQAHEAEVGPNDGRSLATHLLLRMLLGFPDDLLWRLTHIRAREVGQPRDYRTMTFAAGGIAAVMIGALLVNTIIGEIEYYRQVELVPSVHQVVMLYTYGPVSLAAIAGGFWFTRQAPMLCALLVTAGSAALAILAFWLIVPELIAAGISYYAIRRARRIQAGG